MGLTGSQHAAAGKEVWPQHHLGCGEGGGQFREGWAAPSLNKRNGFQGPDGASRGRLAVGCSGLRADQLLTDLLPDSTSRAWLLLGPLRTEDLGVREEAASHAGGAPLTPATAGVLCGAPALGLALGCRRSCLRARVGSPAPLGCRTGRRTEPRTSHGGGTFSPPTNCRGRSDSFPPPQTGPSHQPRFFQADETV